MMHLLPFALWACATMGLVALSILRARPVVVDYRRAPVIEARLDRGVWRVEEAARRSRS
jgi:hypothetical protein